MRWHVSDTLSGTDLIAHGRLTYDALCGPCNSKATAVLTCRVPDSQIVCEGAGTPDSLSVCRFSDLLA